jgi:hypothetical protein
MRLRPRQGLLVGLAVLAAGAVVLEVALARTVAALLGPHFVLAASTLALAGAGLGGALLAALPGLVRRAALLARMSLLSALAAAGTLATVLVLVHVKVPDTLNRAALGPAALVYLTAALPFVMVGIAVAGAVRHVPVLAGRVVLALFAGAALGAPLALGAVRASGPRAVLCVVLVDGVAALFFYLGARGAHPSVRRARGGIVATVILAGVVLLAGDVGAPWLKLPGLRFSTLDKVEVQEWSGVGLLTVDKAVTTINWIRTDGTSAVPLYDGKTAIPVTPDEMGYVILHDAPTGVRESVPVLPPVAILGGGAGREVRLALKYGQKEIYAVDLDPILVRTVMLDRYKKVSGDVYDNPLVKVVFDEGRGFVRRELRNFGNIVLALPDAQLPEAAGALATEPRDLYTVEAFAELLEHLVPGGILTVSRWDGETDRLIALAAAALRRTDATDPPAHLFACSFSRTTTLVVRRTPIPAADVTLLRNFCRKGKMTESFAPDHSHTSLRYRLASEPEVPDVAALTPPAPPAPVMRQPVLAAAAAVPPGPPVAVDLRPPTGDRPFFGDTVPASELAKALTEKTAPVAAQGLIVLAGLLALVALVVFFAVGMPLAAWPRWHTGRVRPLLFFTGVGAGLAFAAAALVPRLVVLLGHPIYAYTTVLPSLFVALGAGGVAVRRVRPFFAAPTTGFRAELLVVVLAGAAVALGPLVEVGVGLPFGARVAVALVLLVPVGVLGGALLALGIRQVGARSPQLLPWCWGMTWVGAFTAAVTATPLVMVLGYSAALLAGGASALVAAACVPRMVRGV